MATIKHHNPVTRQNAETITETPVVKKSHMQLELDLAIAQHGPDGIYAEPYHGFPHVVAWLEYVIVKVAVRSRAYLPEEYQVLAERRRETFNVDIDEWRETAGDYIREAIQCGDAAHAIDRAFKGIAEKIGQRDGYDALKNKRLLREEETDRDQRYAVAVLTSPTPESVQPEPDPNCDRPHEDPRAYMGEKAVALFEAVKAAHPYASPKRWECFRLFCLKVPNSEIAKLLKISAQRVSKNNLETAQWLLAEIHKSPELCEYYQAWLKSLL